MIAKDPPAIPKNGDAEAIIARVRCKRSRWLVCSEQGPGKIYLTGAKSRGGTV